MFPALASVAGNLVKNPAAAIVRAGRVAYIGSAGLIAFATFNAWRKGSKSETFLTSLQKNKIVAPASTGAQAVSVGGWNTATNGAAGSEPFSRQSYQQRIQTMERVARSFGLSLSSAGRTEQENRDAGGSDTSLHLFKRGALAFDLTSGSGPVSEAERKAYTWAVGRTDLFQEVLLHDAGSGMHVHIAFRPGITKVPSLAKSYASPQQKERRTA